MHLYIYILTTVCVVQVDLYIGLGVQLYTDRFHCLLTIVLIAGGINITIELLWDYNRTCKERLSWYNIMITVYWCGVDFSIWISPGL